jgi:hypothetical protein
LDFVLAVQPIAMQGLYSKSPHMVAACEGALRNIAAFHPQHILPLLISNVEQSLVDVNSSHRMMSRSETTSSDSGGDSHNDGHCMCSHSVLRLTLFSIHSAHSLSLSVSAAFCFRCVSLSLSSVCRC